MNSKTFVIADIHGGKRSLKQCLERSKFDFLNDTLICLGDVADGLPDTVECIEILMKCKKLKYVWGNHDIWLYEWLTKNKDPDIWLEQGGQATIKSYMTKGLDDFKKIKKRHIKFFNKNAVGIYIDKKNRCFVHGGIKENDSHICQDLKFLTWDRHLWDQKITKIDYHKEVFVGHTSIYRWSEKPIWHGNICFMDTGGGYEGKLSMMNVETREVFQSDLVSELYHSADIYQKYKI